MEKSLALTAAARSVPGARILTGKDFSLFQRGGKGIFDKNIFCGRNGAKSGTANGRENNHNIQRFQEDICSFTKAAPKSVLFSLYFVLKNRLFGFYELKLESEFSHGQTNRRSRTL